MTHSVGLRAQQTVVTVWSTWLYAKRFISPRRWCAHHLGLCKRFPSTCPSTASIGWSCRNLTLSYRRCRVSSRRGCWIVDARRHELDICTEYDEKCCGTTTAHIIIIIFTILKFATLIPLLLLTIIIIIHSCGSFFLVDLLHHNINNMLKQPVMTLLAP